MNWRNVISGVLTGTLIILALIAIAAGVANADPADREGRETFEIACHSFDAAIEYITETDESRCFDFEEEYGFQPWGYLEPIADWGDRTIYGVEWGNGATGVIAVK